MNFKRFLSFMKYTLLVAVVLTTVGISSCSDDDDNGPTKTVWQLVQDNPDLTLLEAQLTAAGFDVALSTPAPAAYTLFAPSDAAMTTLLQTLFNSTDPALFAQIAPTVIQAVLNYHIVASQNLSASLTNGTELTTVQGEKIKVVVTTTGEKTLDTGATSDSKIGTADIKATNGVIHVVDIVLVPPTIGALIVQTLGKVAQPVLLGKDFTTLSAAIQKADAGKPQAETIIGALVTMPAVTMFAIPNAVFAGAPTPITVDTYTAAQWNSIIRGHIVAETLTTLSSGTKTSINGKTITITGGASATVKGAGNPNAVPIAAAGISSSNGVVYPIGGILIHP
jgi:transforming growth factor-beta-induced protein